jgi:hypothetical protein
MDKINKLTLPTTIIIASLILGGFFYAAQVSEQKSIEKQQETSNALEELKLKQDECETLSAGARKQWNNVIGVTYDNDLKECILTQTDPDTGETETKPLILFNKLFSKGYIPIQTGK